jgi:hypothetical protein
MQGYAGLSVSAPAGTKRISNLLRSLKGSVLHIDEDLLKKADEEVRRRKELGTLMLCIWDGSVLEKAESRKLEGLCPVVSSKAKRLNRSQKGLVFNFPPKKAVTLAEMQGTGALIAGMEGMVHVALMSWWTTRGDYASRMREHEEAVLRQCVRQWGNLLVQVFDRGDASGPCLQVLESVRARFVIRWKKGHFFLTTSGQEKKLWQIGQGKKSLSHKLLHDVHTGEKMPCDSWWTPRRHSAYASTLYLLRVRVRRKVWYLVTNEQIRKEDQAWDIVFA